MSRQGKNIDQSGTTVKVFYNSACPVCDSGCRLIRNELNSSESSGDAEWLDIHENPAAIDELNSNLEQARERLHVIDTEGRQRVGIDAFIAIKTIVNYISKTINIIYFSFFNCSFHNSNKRIRIIKSRGWSSQVVFLFALELLGWFFSFSFLITS